MKFHWFKNSWKLFKKSVGQFYDLNGLKLSAALSFYTIFSIAPFLIVIIFLAGIFLASRP